MSGPLTKSIEALENSIAESYYFQQWQGNAWDSAEAREHIWPYGLPDAARGGQCIDLEAYRPFVEIYHSPEGGLVYSLDASANTYLDSGVLVARFEQSVLPENQANKRDAEAAFDLFIDNLVRTGDAEKPGIAELAALSGYLFFQVLDVQPAVRTSPSEQTTMGDAQARYLVFEWGME